MLAAYSEFPWLCDHLARLENPEYVAGALRGQMFAYFSPEDFRGKRMLDFGCGIGASSIVMAQWLPETWIVGAELDPERVRIAKRIAEFKGVRNVSFEASPGPEELPGGIGEVDFIMMSAVYEHLLPQQRRALMPLLWERLKPGGAIFINQTPFRWFPYEHHSTRLWFINYLPDSLACYAARHFSRRLARKGCSLTWADLLEGGIRGATEREILRNLTARSGVRGAILQPSKNGYRDRAAYWLAHTNPARFTQAKRAISELFRLSDRLFGIVPSTNIDVVIQKPL